MSSAVFQKKENSVVFFDMTIEANVFEEAISKAYKKVVKKINIQGFRKGKAPRKLVEKYYGEGVFYDEAVEEAFPIAYMAAVQELGLFPIDRPSITEFKQIGSGKDLILEVSVAVKPEADVKKYKGLEVKKSIHTVTDEEVEEAVATLQEKNARIESRTDRKIENGDIAVIDFTGYVDGAKFEGGEAEDFEIEIGSGTFIAGFEDQLVGKTAGEDVEVNVTFPDNYHVPTLKSQPAKFDVKIKEVKVKELPTIDEEFVQDVSEFNTVDELKEDIRKGLVKAEENRAENDLEDELIEALVENTEVDTPDVLVNSEIDRMVQQFSYSLYMQGLNIEQYMNITGNNNDSIRAGFKEDAVKSVKAELALAKIQQIENITVTDEDIEKEIEEMANKVNKPTAEYKEQLAKTYAGYKEDISYQVAREKTIKILKDNAVITE